MPLSKLFFVIVFMTQPCTWGLAPRCLLSRHIIFVSIQSEGHIMTPEAWPYFLDTGAEPPVLWLWFSTHCAESLGGPGTLPARAAVVTGGSCSVRSRPWPAMFLAVTSEAVWPGVKIAKYGSRSLELCPQLHYLLTLGVSSTNLLF